VGVPPFNNVETFAGREGGLAPANVAEFLCPAIYIWYLPAVARKWSNRNLPGALHYLTGNIARQLPVFAQTSYCEAFIDTCSTLRSKWPFKLIAYVLMPDHIHLIVNPKDGRIRELAGTLKSLSARRIIDQTSGFSFLRERPDTDGSVHQVWQESFKALPLWSEWLIWQKINYIHNNPLKAGLVRSASDYRWSSFRSFYLGESELIEVDREWWWPDDVRKLATAAAEWSAEMSVSERENE
jgi:putative transposase